MGNRRQSVLLAAALLTPACSSDEPAPRVEMSLSAQVNRAGACPTPPGAISDCISQTSATVTFVESAGAPALITDLQATACGPFGCQEICATGSPFVPPVEREIEAMGSLVVTCRTGFHPFSRRPEVVRATARVLSPRATADLEAEFRIGPPPSSAP